MGQKQHKSSSHSFENLNQQQVAELQKLYKKFAHTKGKIGAKDFRMMIFHIGQSSNECIKRGVYTFDDLPGWQLQEFVHAPHNIGDFEVEKMAFNALDADGSGTIDCDELLVALDKLKSPKRSDWIEMFFLMGSGRKETLGEKGVNFFQEATKGSEQQKMKYTPDLTVEDFKKQAGADPAFITCFSLQSLKDDITTATSSSSTTSTTTPPTSTTEPKLYKGGDIVICPMIGDQMKVSTLDGDSDVIDLKQYYNDRTGTPMDQIDFYTHQRVLLMEGTKLGIYDLSGPVKFVPVINGCRSKKKE